MPHTREQLLALPCRQQAARPIGAADAAAQARALPAWRLEGQALARRFEFADFHQTMAFVNAVAWIAHREDHHPEITVGYRHCELRYSTHDTDGLSIKDFICAAQVDALRADG
jgi:4a-hydroxytetrahydrobiopterin dehydratase